MTAAAPFRFDLDIRPSLALYLAVGLEAGAVIALQICIMRIFQVGSWAHFGSLVVSLAMLGFGLTSAIMCIRKDWFDRRWRGVAASSLMAFGPLTVAANFLAQEIPFNAIFLISDPMQKWRLFGNFVLYMLPFLAGAFYLGTVFLKANKIFGRVYFADLSGAGLCGLAFLAAMYLAAPENLIVVPLLMWFAGGACWFLAVEDRRSTIFLTAVAALSIAAHFALPALCDLQKLSVSDYKGVSYARKFPDSVRVYENSSPFGYLEIYSSSYLHFAPGLSDNAAFNLPKMPDNAYLGMYIDSEGPSGIIRNLPPNETAYYRYLPMIYPYLIKQAPETFVVQFGGGISTSIALRNSRAVTVAEGNPAVLRAFRTDKNLRDFTGDVLNNPKLRVIDYDGRLYLAHASERYDVIDLSLADSAGLSSPGGFAIVEKFSYSREAMTNYMRALKDGGVLSVTLWNKEEPPKSVLKLYVTMAMAARAIDGDAIADRFFVASTYLSTATVLYKRGGFTADEIAKLREHTRAMSFDEIYYPGFRYDAARTDEVLKNYRAAVFAEADGDNGEHTRHDAEPGPPPDRSDSAPLPATTMGQLAWHHLVHGGFEDIADRYAFDIRPLTNGRPYFAAYVKPGDLLRITDRLELFQDEWGYLLLWATLAIACLAAMSLVLIPLAFGWRTIFRRNPGKFRTIVYFACLGAGYIMVEVGMISEFMLALSNATVSASVLITGMLVFSGLGAYASERILNRARTVMPKIFIAIGLLLIGYGLFLDRVLDLVGTLPYGWRMVLCFALIFPPAFLMGFPMPTAMTSLARLGKDHMFLWAWGINGCFSVIGAAAVPIIATSFGLTAVIIVAGCAYLLALPAFFAVLLPMTQAPVSSHGEGAAVATAT
jgi:spermidine synthase